MKVDITVNPAHEITEKDLRTTETGHLYSDDAAAAIAVRDFDTCNMFVQRHQWAAKWIDADTLVQSPQSLSPWGQGIGTRASVPNFLLSNTLDSIVPKIVGGMFYEDPPFLLRPRPGTSDETIRGKTRDLSYQLADMNFAETTEDCIYDMGLLGTMIGKWGWHEETRSTGSSNERRSPKSSPPQSVSRRLFTPKIRMQSNLKWSSVSIVVPISRKRNWEGPCRIRPANPTTRRRRNGLSSGTISIGKTSKPCGSYPITTYLPNKF